MKNVWSIVNHRMPNATEANKVELLAIFLEKLIENDTVLQDKFSSFVKVYAITDREAKEFVGDNPAEPEVTV